MLTLTRLSVSSSLALMRSQSNISRRRNWVVGSWTMRNLRSCHTGASVFFFFSCRQGKAEHLSHQASSCVCEVEGAQASRSSPVQRVGERSGQPVTGGLVHDKAIAATHPPGVLLWSAVGGGSKRVSLLCIMQELALLRAGKGKELSNSLGETAS